jgi:hypothetical protein
MRRRLELLIPIVLLAIAVQLFAPIAAFRAFAYAVNDPLYMASICTDMGAAADDAQTAPARTQHHNGDCCAFCAGGHGGATALQPPRIPAPLLAGGCRRHADRACRLERPGPRAAAVCVNLTAVGRF